MTSCRSGQRSAANPRLRHGPRGDGVRTELVAQRDGATACAIGASVPCRWLIGSRLGGLSTDALAGKLKDHGVVDQTVAGVVDQPVAGRGSRNRRQAGLLSDTRLREQSDAETAERPGRQSEEEKAMDNGEEEEPWIERDLKSIREILPLPQHFAKEHPAVALAEARKLVEAVCGHVLRREVVSHKAAAREELNTLIGKLRSNKLIPSRIQLSLRTVQTFGNWGAHYQGSEGEVTQEDMATCLSALGTVVGWFFETYGDSQDSPMPESRRFSPAITSYMETLRKKVERLTEDQYQILHHIRWKSRVAISGCAGSGKTLLVAEKALRLDAAGIRTLVLCHSPLLSQLIKSLVGTESISVFDITTFVGILAEKDMQDPQAWTTATEPLDEDLESAFDRVAEFDDQFEAIIVDEGQDFRELWWLLVEAVLEKSERKILYIFFDDNQALLPFRARYPIESLPLTMSRNCRNAGRVFDVVRRFHRNAPLVSRFLEEEGAAKVTSYREDYSIAVDSALAEASLQCANGRICVLTNEAAASASVLNGFAFVARREHRWREVVLEDLSEMRKSAIRKFESAHSGSSHSEVANRFRMPLGTTASEFLGLPALSPEPIPNKEDIAAVVSFARKLTGFFGGAKSYRRVYFRQKNGKLTLEAESITHKRTSVNRAARVLFYSQSDWAETLPIPERIRVVSHTHVASRDPGSLPLYTVDAFKGLECDGVILFIPAFTPEIRRVLYVGASRAVGYLHIVIADRVIAKIQALEEVRA